MRGGTRWRMRVKVAALIISGLASAPVFATNGFNLIGFGAESTLMGGADVAVARDTSALNTNPAGLTQISGQAFDGFGSILRTFDLAHKDQFGNDDEASNKYTLLGGGGYARSLESMPCTVGVGLFAQGGAGGVFDNLNTVFGTKDTFSSLFGIAKITPGFGCQVSDKLSLGASLAIVYAKLDEKVFPNTQFHGITIKNADTIKVGFKLGAQYRVSPQLTLGAAYTEKTSLPLSGNHFTFNMGGTDVNYHNVKINGFALPREIAFGAAFKPDDALLLSLKLNWINWADALTTGELRATDPDNGSAPASIQIPSTLNWKNQWVIATGLAYTLNEKTTLYTGYNYGRNPIPTNHTTPQLAGILEHHITLGAAYRWTPEWTFTGGVEYDPDVKVNYTNSELPFGSNSQLRNEALFLHFMVSRRW